MGKYFWFLLFLVFINMANSQYLPRWRARLRHRIQAALESIASGSHPITSRLQNHIYQLKQRQAAREWDVQDGSSTDKGPGSTEEKEVQGKRPVWTHPGRWENVLAPKSSNSPGKNASSSGIEIVKFVLKPQASQSASPKQPITTPRVRSRSRSASRANDGGARESKPASSASESEASKEEKPVPEKPQAQIPPQSGVRPLRTYQSSTSPRARFANIPPWIGHPAFIQWLKYQSGERGRLRSRQLRNFLPRQRPITRDHEGIGRAQEYLPLSRSRVPSRPVKVSLNSAAPSHPLYPRQPGRFDRLRTRRYRQKETRPDDLPEKLAVKPDPVPDESKEELESEVTESAESSVKTEELKKEVPLSDDLPIPPPPPPPVPPPPIPALASLRAWRSYRAQLQTWRDANRVLRLENKLN